MRLGTTEIVLIIILALVIFGGGKIAGLGKALGQSIHDFRKSLRDDQKESAEAKEAATDAAKNDTTETK